MPKCPTCGSDVLIEGKTTRYFVPIVSKSTLRRYREALERIADPRLRHKEPDNYTELGCVMNIAAEALRETGENRDMERLGKDASE